MAPGCTIQPIARPALVGLLWFSCATNWAAGRRRPIGGSSLRMEQEVFSLLTGEVDKILWKWKSIGGGLNEVLRT
jgi:hypothetical protein